MELVTLVPIPARIDRKGRAGIGGPVGPVGGLGRDGGGEEAGGLPSPAAPEQRLSVLKELRSGLAVRRAALGPEGLLEADDPACQILAQVSLRNLRLRGEG